MKKLFLALFVLASSVAFCQTTDDEYNYMIKGYAAQVSQGLDMKQGYSFTDKGTITYQSMNVDVKYLYRTNGNVFAGALLIVTGAKGAKGALATQYFCVPAAGSVAYMWNNTLSYMDQAFGGDKSNYEGVMFAVMHMLTN
jgi:hypothetical protein